MALEGIRLGIYWASTFFRTNKCAGIHFFVRKNGDWYTFSKEREIVRCLVLVFIARIPGLRPAAEPLYSRLYRVR